MDSLNPGLAWVVDFAENMNEIVKINGEWLAGVSAPFPAQPQLGVDFAAHSCRRPLTQFPRPVLSLHKHFLPICHHSADDLDVVVQPGVGYEALNATLAEKGIPLFFPVDPAPCADFIQISL